MQAIPLVGSALGIGSALFGGGGQQQQSQQQSQSSQMGENWQNQSSQQGSQSGAVDMTNPWFRALGQQAAGGLQSLLAGGQGSFNPYSGPFTSAMLPGAQQALGGIQQAAADPMRAALLQQTLGGGFLPGQGGSNPYLASAIASAQEPTRQALETAVQRRIPGMFAAAGQQVGTAGGSSPYARELGNAAFQGGRALGDIATNLSFQAYEAERARQQQAISLGQQDVQAQLANVQAQWLPQAIQEQGIDRAIATGQQGIGNLLSAFQIAQGYPLQSLAQQSSSFGTSQGTGYGYQQGSSSSSGSSTGSASPNLVSNLFGNLGAVPGSLSAFGLWPGQVPQPRTP